MKQLQKNDFINSLLASAVGTDVDTSRFAVYEVAATSNIPLRGKDGTIFEKAVIEPLTLHQLAMHVNRDPLPLMMDHNMNGSPFGKFFYAQVLNNDEGYQELRGYQYIDPSESAVIAKTDSSTIDEVSIAFQAAQMKCSKCDYDYAVDVANENFMPLIERTCANGHKIGQDGTHLRLNGVADAFELSLVSRGAAKNSKIIGQSDSKLGKQIERLAAHGLELSDIYVTASASKGNDDMDTNELIVKLTDARVEAATEKSRADRLEQEHAAAVGEKNTAEARVRELEAELAEARQAGEDAPKEEDKIKNEKNETDAKAAVDFLKPQYVAVLSAAGKDVAEDKVPTDVADLIAGITEHKAELSAILPIGGATEASGASQKEEMRDFSAFRPIHSNKR